MSAMLNVIRRAMSTPLLCRDDQTENTEAYVYIPVSSKARKKQHARTWSRLVEHRGSPKQVIPSISQQALQEEEEDERDDGKGPGNPSSRHLGHVNLASSSCDLAPTLISIYDTYATSAKSVTFASCDIQLNGDDPTTTSTTTTTSSTTSSSSSSASSSGCSASDITSSCDSTSFSSSGSSTSASTSSSYVPAKNEVTYLDGNKNVDTQSCSKHHHNHYHRQPQHQQQQEHPHHHSSQCSSTDGLQCSSCKKASPLLLLSSSALLPTTTPIMEDSSVSMTSVLTSPRHHPPHHHHHDGVISPASIMYETDAKKRPLSVSSTSSSASSTSSLPRHQRKKIATYNVDSLLLESREGESGGSTTETQHPATPAPAPTSRQSSRQSTSSETMDMDTSPSSLPAPDANNSSPYSSNAELLSPGRSSTNSSNSNVSLKIDFNRMDNSEDNTKSASASPNPSRFNLDLVGGSYIEKVVSEILDTERTYVHDLKDIIQGYLHHLVHNPDLPINHDDMRDLFGNIEEVYRFNSDFLSCLEECEGNPVKVAECFVEQNEGFVIYADYCTNYPKSVEVLTRCMRDVAMADTLKQQQVALHHGLPLGSYLLKPVQRILKYHLLLQNILNNFDKSAAAAGSSSSVGDSGGYDTISAALDSMTSMAQHINEMKRKHEHAVRIQEIQSCLYGWEGDDLTTYGDLILEDTFRMSGAKAMRHLFLFEKCVLIAKRKEDGNLLTKAHIMNSNLMLIESIPREPLNFHIIPFNNPRIQYTLQAKNLDQKRAWCQDLKRLMLENFSAVIPQKAKELVMMLGKSREEEAYEDSNAEPATKSNAEPSKKSHNAPEYLEKKRKGRRRSTSIIPDFAMLRGQKSKKSLKNKAPSGEGSPSASPKRQHGTPTASKHPGAVPYEQKRASLGEETLEEEEGQREEEIEEKVDEVIVQPIASTPTGHLSPSSRSRSLESINDLMASTHDLSAQSSHRSSRVIDSSTTGFVDVVPLQTCMSAARTLQRPVAEDVEEEEEEDEDDDDDDDDDDYEYVEVSNGSMSGLNSSTNSKLADGIKLASSSDDVKENCVEDNADNAVVEAVVEDDDDDRGIVMDLGFEPGESSDGDLTVIYNEEPEKKTETESQFENLLFSDGALKKLDFSYLDGESSTDNDVSARVEDNCDTAGCLLPAQKMLERAEHVETRVDSLKRLSSSNSESRLSGSWKPGCYDSLYFGQTKQYDKRQNRHSIIRSRSSVGCPSSQRVDSSVIPVSHRGSLSANTSPLHRASEKSAIMDSLHGLPLQSTGAYRNSVSISSNKVSVTDMEEDDPWVPRTIEHMKEEVKIRQVMRQRSITTADRQERPVVVPRSRLFRSNSFSSVEELDKIHRKGHVRMPSGSNIVFSNYSAFVATSSPRVIRKDTEAQRTIDRLGTPLREFGPPDLLQEIARYREHGRIVTRYATPPRSLANDSEDVVDEVGTGVRLRRKSPTGNDRPSTMHTEPSPEVKDKRLWEDLEDLISTTPPEMPSPSSPVSSQPRPGSFHGTTQYSVHPPTPSSNLSSPSSAFLHSPPSATSMTSSESIVDSLKNAVMNFTARFTGRSMRSTESSPVRTPRARSAGAIEDFKVNQSPPPRPPPPKIAVSPKINKESKSRREKRHRFVYQLARAYSDRIKRKTYDRTATPLEDDDDEMKEIPPGFNGSMELSKLLREQGGSAIGERMALSKPVVLGTYTLPRHRSRKKKPTTANKHIPEESESPSACAEAEPVLEEPVVVVMRKDSNANPVPEGDITDGEGEKMSSTCGELDLLRDLPSQTVESTEKVMDAETKASFRKSFHQLLGIPFLDDGSESDPTTDAHYYERKFVEDLENSLEDTTNDTGSLFKDGRLFADDPTDSDELAALKVNILQTVKLIEQRNNKPIPKIQVKQDEKAVCFKDILRNLEATASGASGVSMSPDSDAEHHPLDRAAAKKMRDRSRELTECAMLTRIRQNSFGDDSETREHDPFKAVRLRPDDAAAAPAEEEENLPRKGR